MSYTQFVISVWRRDKVVWENHEKEEEIDIIKKRLGRKCEISCVLHDIFESEHLPLKISREIKCSRKEEFCKPSTSILKDYHKLFSVLALYKRKWSSSMSHSLPICSLESMKIPLPTEASELLCSGTSQSGDVVISFSECMIGMNEPCFTQWRSPRTGGQLFLWSICRRRALRWFTWLGLLEIMEVSSSTYLMVKKKETNMVPRKIMAIAIKVWRGKENLGRTRQSSRRYGRSWKSWIRLLGISLSLILIDCVFTLLHFDQNLKLHSELVDHEKPRTSIQLSYRLHRYPKHMETNQQKEKSYTCSHKN